MDKLIITPKTKIFELLQAYPQLEDTLMDSSPHFKKLRNPVLRKTITKITSLSQAAIIGGLNVEELINKLRSEIGQSEISSIDQATNYNTRQPEWYSAAAVANEIDIREMLNAGEHPVHEVLSAINKLHEGELLKIIAPFIPAPLIDKTLSLGARHWLDQKDGDEYHIFFTSKDK